MCPLALLVDHMLFVQERFQIWNSEKMDADEYYDVES